MFGTGNPIKAGLVVFYLSLSIVLTVIVALT